jgi:hypothetical protein
MTESAYLAWIRSALRSKSLRWPPRGEALIQARRPYVGPNKRQKWEYKCKLCQGWFNAKEVIVDHYPKPAGSILCAADIGPFAETLFCEVNNLRCLCVPCHNTHTLSEANGVSFEEAKLDQKVIEICKLPTKEVVAYLAKHGYNGASVSNADKRKALVIKLIKGETK